MQKEGEDKYYFVRTPSEALQELETRLEGLSEQEANERLLRFGPNSIAYEDKYATLKMFFSKFNSLLIYVLFGSAIISLLSDHMIEFIIIIILIIATVFLSFIQEYGAGKAVKALTKLTAKKVEVIRNKKKMVIPSETLVPGDIVVLSRGMIVPADLRIVQCSGLSVDESILTGEPVQKRKNIDRIEDHETPLSDRTNMAFGGTNVTGGQGLGVVVATGFQSEIGKISETLKSIGSEKTPLQKKVDTMSENISYLIIAVALLFFLVLLMQQYEFYEALLLVGAVIVSGIPESFPLALTVALSSGVRKMAGKNAIVKDLGSVETLGTTTVICTDKTGTLTENKMTVTRMYAQDCELFIEGKGYEPLGEFFKEDESYDKKKLKNFDEFFKACILCSNAETDREKGEWILQGEPTEGALLTLAKSADYDSVVIREENKRVHEIPFDPAHKFMVSVNEDEGSGKKTAYLKGAVEKVLEKSSHVRTGKGLKKLTAQGKKKILKKVHDCSADALRVLGVATKSLTEKYEKELEARYVFEGFVGIEDPIRKDVYEAVEECMKAGIKVIIVTGDHMVTAQSIGKRLGLIKNRADLVVEGHELEKMDDEELRKTIGDIAVFARTTPDHKFRIVRALQDNGEIVAMTGDGVNDAPALKKADIGVSMGKNGTEVAREASNLVLADDNFSTIVEAVKQGRTIYSNIRRFIFYLLTVNFSEVSLIVFAVLIGMNAPLTALMVLFINLVTSVFPSLALSVEPTHKKVMSYLPRDPKEKLLSKYLLLKILVYVPIVLFGTFSLYVWELHMGSGDLARAMTVAFATVIMFELFHTFNARSLHTTIFGKHFLSNRYVFISVLASLVMMLTVIHTAFGNMIFGTVPLDIWTWIVITIVASSILIVSEIIKLLIQSEFKEQSNLRGQDFMLE